MDSFESIRNMEMPSVYKPFHYRTIETLTKLGFENRIQALRARVQDEPEMINKKESLDDSHALRATQLLTQARRFIELGIAAEDEIKPLLLYYGVAQVCGFFSCSMCKYDLSGGHGIKMDNNNLDVSVRDRGSFIRLLDICSLLGLKSPYSRWFWDERASDFVESSSSTKYPFSQPLHSFLKDFDRIVALEPSDERTVALDHISYIILFAASHLARYRPEIWKGIIEGQGEDTSMIEYRRVMEGAREFYHKIGTSVLAASKGISPRHVFNTNELGDATIIWVKSRPSNSL